MTVTKHKKNQVRASKDTPKKLTSKKGAAVKAKSAKKPSGKTVSSRKTAAPLKKKSPVGLSHAQAPKKESVAVARTMQVAIRKDVIPVATQPSAQTCPLVLDGIVAAEDFSPRDCFSCDEFDCRFYSAEERSGPLGSRLFAGDEEGDEDLEDAELFGFERGEGDSDQWGDEDEK